MQIPIRRSLILLFGLKLVSSVEKIYLSPSRWNIYSIFAKDQYASLETCPLSNDLTTASTRFIFSTLSNCQN
ncbi:hypothetical protein RIR_jg28486.t1 [Rhizophagus irregularis DAOM 181602=DAOM 197198]|nr:hypothetical protein RhiirB3_456146 [Rhizophagus irregularis]GET53143.1 hypothetical protein RIR_jg28486.t1 [Rhizophagus irregularis DAOM 181602=DAOM 197198]